MGLLTEAKACNDGWQEPLDPSQRTIPCEVCHTTRVQLIGPRGQLKVAKTRNQMALQRTFQSRNAIGICSIGGEEKCRERNFELLKH